MSSIIEKEVAEYYDLLNLLEVMEKRGYKKKDEVWDKYICEWGVSNGTIFWLGFDYYSYTEKEEEYKEYFKGVNKLLGLDESNDGIMVNAFW
ncbi:hypothetical protein [Bacillus sp. Marseille-P3800]|uniref:hypothetical protein n=1 Tax=Bacillus sp. Marseille-P3800 TaxID=2014782 RepID=UPI001C3F3691|nr:hypothetical protein [Bacillus sp. Marseille-P3800]